MHVHLEKSPRIINHHPKILRIVMHSPSVANFKSINSPSEVL